MKSKIKQLFDYLFVAIDNEPITMQAIMLYIMQAKAQCERITPTRDHLKCKLSTILHAGTNIEVLFFILF